MVIVLLVLFILLFVLLLYMIKPNKKRIDGLPVSRYAHRGLHGEGIPENSLLAFRLAGEKNYGVELDVRLSWDKKLVVFHDDTLKRMCGEDRKINTLTFEQLKEYQLSDSDETIPLFSDVLKVLKGLPIICEIKSNPGEPVSEICEAVCQEIKGYKGFVCIESFNPFAVQWFRKNRPDIIRGQLSMHFKKKEQKVRSIDSFLMTHLFINFISRPDFIAYRFEDDSFGYFLCRKIFQPIQVTWTVKDEVAIKEAERKYHGVIFEEC